MKRDNGYYWVKYRGEWRVAEWWNNIWLLTCTSMDIFENILDQINETRILSPDEQLK